MSNPSLNRLVPDFGEFSPDALWPEEKRAPGPDLSFSSAEEPEAAPSDTTAVPEAAESPAQRARREAMETFGEALRRYSSMDAAPSSPLPQDDEVPAAIGVSFSPEDSSPENMQESNEPAAPLFQSYEPEETTDTAKEQEKECSTAARATPEPSPTNITDNPTGESSVSASDNPVTPRSDRRAKRSRGSFKERVLTPVFFFLASLTARREMQRIEASKWPEPKKEPLPPEMEPRKAAKFYGTQAKPLRFRCRLALILSLFLAWIGFQLPMAGLLGDSLTAQAGVSLVLMLAVMILALDIITAGFRQLFDLRPGMEALVSLAALLSCVDGALVMGGHGDCLPYCAAVSFTLTAALWGQRLTCSARRRTLLAAGAKNVTVMSLREGAHDVPAKILRAPLEGQSIVRRTEEEDIAQSSYYTAAPILLTAALVLAILASLRGQAEHFLHIFSALLTVSTAFSAFFLFPLPYAMTARRLLDAGSALLGWAGIAELGRRPTLVVTDEDIFPPDDDILEGRIRFSSIYLTEEADTLFVLSCTCSIMAQAQGGLSAPFLQLAKRRNLPLLPVDELTVREGGGYSASIDGGTVYVGSSGFMKLMGVRIPPKMDADTAIYTAIHGELSAGFLMEYSPTKNVQNALVALLRGRTRAIFALQNFCITPRVLGRMFRISADRLTIPSFETRSRLARETARGDTAAALYSLGGLMSAVDLADTGRRLHTACRTGTIISLAGSILGMLILFLLFRAGAFAPASAGNLVLYMALWALPVIILSAGQGR